VPLSSCHWSYCGTRAARAKLAPAVVRAALVAFCCLLSGDSLRADELADEFSKLTDQYAARLDELARWCETNKLDQAAQQTRQWLVRREPLTLYLAMPPEAADPVPAADAPPLLMEWHQKFSQLRTTQADALFALARRAIKAHRATEAFQLVHETARENPDHEAARRILGYQKFEGRWRTPYEMNKARSHQVWHPKYGWLMQDRVARYEAGERYYKGRWIAEAEEARLCREIDRGWEVVTEHYSVRTNHSLEEGVRLATRLERLYRAWQQLFVLYYASETQIGRWLEGGTPETRTPRRHQVVYFRNRDEYNAALRKVQPRIEITTGFYETDTRKAYFFAGPEQDDSILYHEATHQLFSEIRNSRSFIGQQGNFWIVEGIACYMESLVERDGYCLLGGSAAARLRDAQFRLVEDQFFVPLAELVTLSMQGLQRDERIVKLYSESSGMTYFLMHADGGRYRDAVVDYLIAIYTGRDRPNTLAERTGASYTELDRQYREFIEKLKR
jgi:hypothetical protein